MQPGPRYVDALQFSAQLHSTQVRKGSGVPYIAHLLSVSALALEHGATEDEAIAALLHDAAEDQGGEATLFLIARRFGPTVADIVMGCSDSLTEPKPPWRLRKEDFLAELPHKSRSTRLVLACDKLHNARSIVADLRVDGDAVWSRFTGGREGTLWYYRALVDAFAQARSPVGPVDELGRTVSEMQRLAAR